MLSYSLLRQEEHFILGRLVAMPSRSGSRQARGRKPRLILVLKSRKWRQRLINNELSRRVALELCGNLNLGEVPRGCRVQTLCRSSTVRSVVSRDEKCRFEETVRLDRRL
jgi:hypothetical protein